MKVRLPRAPRVEMMMLSSTFMVVQDWASFSTRICKHHQFSDAQHNNAPLFNVLFDPPYQPHPPEDGDPVHRLEAKIEKARHHDRQIEDVPAVAEVFCVYKNDGF